MSKEIYEEKTSMDNENIRISTLASKFPKGSIYIYRGNGRFGNNLTIIRGKTGLYAVDNGKKDNIEYKYKEIILNFSEGLALVQDKNNLWGYIDMDGNEVIPCQFVSAQQFHGGFANVLTTDGRSVRINRDGIEYDLLVNSRIKEQIAAFGGSAAQTMEAPKKEVVTQTTTEKENKKKTFINIPAIAVAASLILSGIGVNIAESKIDHTKEVCPYCLTLENQTNKINKEHNHVHAEYLEDQRVHFKKKAGTKTLSDGSSVYVATEGWENNHDGTMSKVLYYDECIALRDDDGNITRVLGNGK